ncbi:MAG: MOSC domain-containing protein [Coriobacteriales bacterium]|nr:MOSC domain-containing protein [Coriobacteriales bacterium]
MTDTAEKTQVTSATASAAAPATVGTVTSVNISERKGTRKTPLESGAARILIGSGVEGDAHAGDWHRQVSFLAEESIEKARAMGLDVKEGDFAENITTEGIDLPSIPVGTLLRIGDTEVEISQIGKVCHTRCAIYHLAGDCIFPREGIFSVVRKEGNVRVGDTVEVLAWGNGSCSATPQEALDEVEAARAAGTL